MVWLYSDDRDDTACSGDKSAACDGGGDAMCDNVLRERTTLTSSRRGGM